MIRSYLCLFIATQTSFIFAQPRYGIELSQTVEHYFQGSYEIIGMEKHKYKPGYNSALTFYYTPGVKNQLFLTLAYFRVRSEIEHSFTFQPGQNAPPSTILTQITYYNYSFGLGYWDIAIR